MIEPQSVGMAAFLGTTLLFLTISLIEAHAIGRMRRALSLRQDRGKLALCDHLQMLDTREKTEPHSHQEE